MTASFNSILVPTDFSAGSRHAIDYARALADRLGASIHLLHVVEDPSMAGLWTDGDIDMTRARKERQRDARRRLTSLMQEIQPFRGSDEVAYGPVARTIAAVAADRHADLIVMGTHGRTGLAHVLLGSVAEHVIRIAGCPVLTARAGMPGTAVVAPAVREASSISTAKA